MSEQPPRVLHVGKYLPPVPGGIETYLGDLLRIAMRHGTPVGAIVHEKRGYPKPNPDDFGGARIYSVPTHGELVYAPVAPTFPWMLREAIRDFEPDILHLHMPNPSVFTALMLPTAKRIPWVVHWHADVDPQRADLSLRVAYAFYRPWETALLKRQHRVVTTSDDYKLASEPLAPFINRCITVPLGVDLDRLCALNGKLTHDDAGLWPVTNATKVLTVGRLTYYKGFDVLIRAIARTPTCILVVVGTGRELSKLQELTDALEIRGRVFFVGEVTQSVLARLYSTCDVFCVSSIDRSEAFGITLMEARVFGAPLLASDIPGSGVASVCRSLGGEVFPVGNVTALSARLQSVAGRSTPVDVTQSHLAINFTSMMEIYRDVLGR